jgi:hypothetical protein
VTVKVSPVHSQQELTVESMAGRMKPEQIKVVGTKKLNTINADY